MSTTTWVYLNGQFVARDAAQLDIEDRGTLFGDGVYEVTRYYAGRALAMADHIARLKRSLREVAIDEPHDLPHFAELTEELIHRNNMPDAAVYWQITRGVAPRTKRSAHGLTPTVLMIAYPAQPLSAMTAPKKTTAILTPDIRWHRCDIKSLMLLPTILAQHEADAAGADTAILHRDGIVTEATSANIFIVRDGELITHPADQWILGGISRKLVIDVAGLESISVSERRYTVEEMLAADEVLICGTTTHIGPVTRIDDHIVHGGETGPMAKRLNAAFLRYVRAACGV